MIDFIRESREMTQQLSAWRRDFHRHPELRFEEVRTADIVAAHLRSLDIETHTSIGKTGVVGLLEGQRQSPVVLLRFDMDALPISEENAMEYASQNPGVMHACGHDTHVAMGLGAARLLAKYRTQLNGTVKFVFQPAEEGAGGARAMIDDGVLEQPKPDYVFGIHIDATRPTGVVAIGEGPILAAADSFHITIRGRGGHGALPEQTVDALMTGVQVVGALQTILSRNIGLLDSALISVCSFQSGAAFNIIPETACLQGTIRTYDPSIQALVHQRMSEVVHHTASAYGASAELDIKNIVPAAVNDPAMAALTRQLAAEIFRPQNVISDYRAAPSDDIAEFLSAAPGCQFILGAAVEGGYPHHNPRFDIDEAAMPLGVALLCKTASSLLI